MNQSVTKTQTQIDYILLDCSSSMSYQWAETLAAIDRYISSSRIAGVSSRAILHPFYSSNPDYIHVDTTLDTWQPLSTAEEQITALGGTPLYDAVNAMGRRIAALDPPRCHCIIVTDGDDNQSHTTLAQARSVLDWLRAKGYQITFIGADFSNAAQARLLGADSSAAIGVQKALLSDAAAALAKKRAAYGATGQDIHFTKDEQQQFGGYLAAPQS